MADPSPFYRGSTVATPNVPKADIPSGAQMYADHRAGLVQTNAAVAEFEDAAIDRIEYGIDQANQVRIKQIQAKASNDFTYRLSLADGASGSFFDALGRFNEESYNAFRNDVYDQLTGLDSGYIRPESSQRAYDSLSTIKEKMNQTFSAELASQLTPRAKRSLEASIELDLAQHNYTDAARAVEGAPAGLLSPVEKESMLYDIRRRQAQDDLNLTFETDPQQAIIDINDGRYKDFFAPYELVQMRKKAQEQLDKRTREQAVKADKDAKARLEWYDNFGKSTGSLTEETRVKYREKLYHEGYFTKTQYDVLKATESNGVIEQSTVRELTEDMLADCANVDFTISHDEQAAFIRQEWAPFFRFIPEGETILTNALSSLKKKRAGIENVKLDVSPMLSNSFYREEAREKFMPSGWRARFDKEEEEKAKDTIREYAIRESDKHWTALNDNAESEWKSWYNSQTQPPSLDVQRAKLTEIFTKAGLPDPCAARGNESYFAHQLEAKKMEAAALDETRRSQAFGRLPYYMDKYHRLEPAQYNLTAKKAEAGSEESRTLGVYLPAALLAKSSDGRQRIDPSKVTVQIITQDKRVFRLPVLGETSHSEPQLSEAMADRMGVSRDGVILNGCMLTLHSLRPPVAEVISEDIKAEADKRNEDGTIDSVDDSNPPTEFDVQTFATPVDWFSYADDRIGQAIVNGEARRNKNGHLAVYSLPSGDGGGSYEVAGINERYHPQMAARLAGLIRGGYHVEAEQEARTYIANYTKPVRDMLKAAGKSSPALDYFLSDQYFNGGQGGCNKVLRRALNLPYNASRSAIVTAINEFKGTEDQLLTALYQAAESRYRSIAANNPEKRKFLRGWFNRINRTYSNALIFDNLV